MLVSSIRYAFPVFLLCAALVRVNGISLGYLGFFLVYHLFPPLAEGATRAPSARGWKTSPAFWISAVLYALFACIAHAMAQLLLSSGALADSPGLRAAGFGSLPTFAQAARAVGPDVVMLVLGVVCTIVVLRLARRERTGAPSGSTYALRVATFLLLFAAGVASPSLAGAVYFLAFCFYLVLWSLVPARYGHGLPRVNPAAVYVIAAHAVLVYLYQFDFFSAAVGEANGARLGFFRFGGWGRRQCAHYVAYVSELGLMVALSAYGQKRSEVALARSLEAAAAAGKSSAAAPGKASLRRRGRSRQRDPLVAPDGSDDDDDGGGGGGSDSEPRELPDPTERGLSEQARRVLARGIRAHGRKLVLLSVFGLAMTEPSWLSLGLLALFFVGAVARRRQFELLAPPLLLYAALYVLAQYAFAVPRLLPTGARYEMLGLGRHAPVPALFLVVACVPLLLTAGYARLVRSSAGAASSLDALERAAATGDDALLARAAAQRSPHLRPDAAPLPGGQTLLHVAAKHGHADAVLVLLRDARIPAGARDETGSTPLHAAYRHGYDDVCAVLLHQGGAPRGARNEAGRKFSEEPRAGGARAWAAVRQVYRVAEAAFFRHADKVSLVVLYLVGMHRLNWIHLGYILFFLLFFGVPYVARRAWGALVFYAGAVLSVQYAWAVYLSDPSRKDAAQPEWARRAGLFRATNLWRDLFIYYAVVFFVAVQAHVYRRLADNADLLRHQEQRLRAGRFFEFRALAQAVRFVGHLGSSNGLFLAYATLVAVALGGHASLIKAGYLALFLAALAVHQYAAEPARALRAYWVAVVSYTALAFLAQYAYQFPVVHDWVKGAYPAGAALSLRDVGLREIEARDFELIRNLAGPTAAFVMCVFELRAMWGGGGGKGEEEGGYARLDGGDMEVRDADSVATDDDDDDDDEEEDSNFAADENTSPGWMHRQFYQLTHFLKSVMHEHSSKLTLVAVWLVVSTVNTANLLNLVYLVVALAYIGSGGRGVWAPLGGYGSLVLLARFAFQLPSLARGASERTRWYGFDDYNARLYRHLAGDVAIVCLSAVQAVAMRQWSASGRNAAVLPVSGGDEARLRADLEGGGAKEREQPQEDGRPAWRRHLAALGFFALVTWARARRQAGTFFADFGLQVALTMLILCAASRANVMSLLYVGVWLGLYLAGGRERVAAAWRPLSLTLLVTLLFQYYVAMGPFPSGSHHYPWHGMDRRWQRWLMLGGYRTVELNWDFFALMAVSLQAGHFGGRGGGGRGDDDDGGGDGDDDQAVTRGDPEAWYNSFWPGVTERLVFFFDKAVLVLVFFASSMRPDLVSFGYVVVALRLLVRKDLYVGGAASFERHLSHWSRLSLYNYGVLVLAMAYQVPLVRPSGVGGTVRWEDVAGLGQYDGGAADALASDGVADSVLVFVLVDLQMLVFGSRQYRRVLAYYEENRRQAAFRAVESARARKERRMQSLSLILRKRRVFTSKLRHISRRLVAISGTLVSGGADPFRDEEVWPQRWDDDDERDSLEKADSSDEEVEELERRAGGAMDERALEAFAEEDAAGDPDAAGGWTGAARALFERHSDPTLWMLISEDPATGIKYNTAPPPSSLGTLELAQRFVVSNTQALAFFAYVINLLANPSLVSLLVPVLVFVYAIFEEPRAPKGFWLFCLAYSSATACLKFLFQLDVFCVTAADHRYSLQPSPYCTALVSGYTSDHEVAPDFVLGVHKTAPGDFFAYVAWDVVCVIAVVWHRTCMLSKGVWDLSEEGMGGGVADGGLLERSGRWEEGEGEEEEEEESWLSRAWRLVPRPVRAYYRRLIPRDRRHIHLVKPGEDLYMWTFFIELVCAFYILLFYAAMATTAQSSVTSSLSTNLFSGAMVLTLLAQIALIIVDRLLYLRRSLRWKIALQYATVAFWTGLAFFSWPQTAQLGVQENGYLQVFYFFKVCYFLASGLQIKWGYPTVEQTGFQYITRRASVARGYVFRAYRALPFVFELRSLLDWMTHETALDLWEALKLEDIYASMFLVQCDIRYRKQFRRGELQPASTKFFNGTLVFVLLIVIIFAPLLIFSSANPVTDSNNVLGTHVSLSLVGPQGEYRLCGISSMQSVRRVSGTQYGLMKQDRVVADDSQSNIQSIQMVTFADEYWTISAPAREQLGRSLADHQMRAKFVYEFRRPGPPGAKVVSGESVVPLSKAQQEAIAAMVGGGGGGGVVELPQIVPKYLRLPALGSPIVLTEQMLDVFVTVHGGGGGGGGGGVYFSLSGAAGGTGGVRLITISNPVFENPFGFNTFTYSVIGLYSIVLLTVGRFVRLFFADLMVNIPYEDLHDVTDLVALCEAVFISRYARFHHKEEKLYRRLIKVFRTPELVVAMTRRRDL